MNSLIVSDQTSIVPAKADKDTRYRLGKFETWLQAQGQKWYLPDLAAYRDAMLDNDYAPSTVSAHLSTIRATYQKIVLNREAFYQLVPKAFSGSITEQKAYVDEAIARIENAIDPRLSPVKNITKQDIAESEHLRLTSDQANQLMTRAGTDSLSGLRDTAIIALMLCTGIREAELSNLDVDDLRQRLGSELALRVKKGKGCKQRLIPYGDLSWVLIIVDKWLESAGISTGPVFKGFYKGNQKLRPGRLSVRAIQYILESYPIVIDGKLTNVQAHDLRRTYARRLYRAGVDLLAIQQNLGHANQQTTLGYIGELKAETRRPPAVYCFDLGKLK